MIRKKMIDVKVFSSGGREEKVRLFNIPGTDDYYVSGTAFDRKSRKYCGGLHFLAPDRWTTDYDGNYRPITDVPYYVRKIYRMDYGHITAMVYDNLDCLISLQRGMFEYIEKIKNENVRNAVKTKWNQIPHEK